MKTCSPSSPRCIRSGRCVAARQAHPTLPRGASAAAFSRLATQGDVPGAARRLSPGRAELRRSTAQPESLRRPATSIRPPSRSGEAPFATCAAISAPWSRWDWPAWSRPSFWHHTYIDGSLADLPAWTPPGTRDRRSAVGCGPESRSRTSRAGRLDRTARTTLLMPRP